MEGNYQQLLQQLNAMGKRSLVVPGGSLNEDSNDFNEPKLVIDEDVPPNKFPFLSKPKEAGAQLLASATLLRSGEQLAKIHLPPNLPFIVTPTEATRFTNLEITCNNTQVSTLELVKTLENTNNQNKESVRPPAKCIQIEPVTNKEVQESDLPLDLSLKKFKRDDESLLNPGRKPEGEDESILKSSDEEEIQILEEPGKAYPVTLSRTIQPLENPDYEGGFRRYLNNEGHRRKNPPTSSISLFTIEEREKIMDSMDHRLGNNVFISEEREKKIMESLGHGIGNNGEKIWYCLICNHAADNKYNMKRHIESMHIDTPGFQCEICMKPCKTSNDRYRHMKTHIRQALHHDRFGLSKQNFRKMITHFYKANDIKEDTELKCIFCGCFYRGLPNLWVHCKLVHEKWLYCDFDGCKKAYRNKGKLEKHFLSHWKPEELQRAHPGLTTHPRPSVINANPSKTLSP